MQTSVRGFCLWLIEIGYFFVFMLVWFTGCAIADHVLHLDADSWRMTWGYVVVLFAGWLGNKASSGF